MGANQHPEDGHPDSRQVLPKACSRSLWSTNAPPPSPARCRRGAGSSVGALGPVTAATNDGCWPGRGSHVSGHQNSMSIQGHCPQCGLDMHTIYHSEKWQGHKNCLQAPPLLSWVLPQRAGYPQGPFTCCAPGLEPYSSGLI